MRVFTQAARLLLNDVKCSVQGGHSRYSSISGTSISARGSNLGGYYNSHNNSHSRSTSQFRQHPIVGFRGTQPKGTGYSPELETRINENAARLTNTPSPKPGAAPKASPFG